MVLRDIPYNLAASLILNLVEDIMSSVVFFGDKSEHSVAKTGEITKNDVKPSGPLHGLRPLRQPIEIS